MISFNLRLPADFDDYEWEITAKGCFSEALLSLEGAVYRLNFYDATRLQQEVESSFIAGKLFFEPNLLVVQRVDKAKIEEAVKFLVSSGNSRFLLRE